MKRNMTTILLFVVLFVGLALLLYPSVSDFYNSFHQSRASSLRTASFKVGLPRARLHTAARLKSRHRSVFNSHFSNCPSLRCNSTHRL